MHFVHLGGSGMNLVEVVVCLASFNSCTLALLSAGRARSTA
jgi:hypothetical protein